MLNIVPVGIEPTIFSVLPTLGSRRGDVMPLDHGTLFRAGIEPTTQEWKSYVIPLNYRNSKETTPVGFEPTLPKEID